MEAIILIITILAIHVLAWFTPGPNIALLMRNSLIYSRKSGIFTAVGIALSNITHISYSVILLSFFSKTSITAFTLLKFVGVSYLIYLGIKTIMLTSTTQKIVDGHKKPDIAPLQAIKIGFVTNILSPKAPPFFLSIFGGLIASHAPFWVIIFLWIAMPLNSFVMASLYAMFFTHKRIKTMYLRYHSVANILLGLELIIFALIIALH